MMKLQILLALISSSLALSATIIPFSDDADVLFGVPLSLDTSAYSNSIIGTGVWQVNANPSSTMSSFGVMHSIDLFSSGSLDVVTVYENTTRVVELTVNPGLPNEETFSGLSEGLANEKAEKMTWEELQAVKNHQNCHSNYGSLLKHILPHHVNRLKLPLKSSSSESTSIKRNMS